MSKTKLYFTKKEKVAESAIAEVLVSYFLNASGVQDFYYTLEDAQTCTSESLEPYQFVSFFQLTAKRVSESAESLFAKYYKENLQHKNSTAMLDEIVSQLCKTGLSLDEAETYVMRLIVLKEFTDNADLSVFNFGVLKNTITGQAKVAPFLDNEFSFNCAKLIRDSWKQRKIEAPDWLFLFDFRVTWADRASMSSYFPFDAVKFIHILEDNKNSGLIIKSQVFKDFLEKLNYYYPTEYGVLRGWLNRED